LLSLQLNLWNERDAIFIDKTETKTFIVLPCLAGALRSNEQSPQEMKVLIEMTFRNYVSISSSDSHDSMIEQPGMREKATST